MRRLSDTVERLAAFRSLASAQSGAEVGRLSGLDGFGSNPGALLGKIYVPEALPKGSPLVVVLHGCTQTADGYDRGSGWSALADKAGFSLLYPEQTRANNANLCFNWFQPGDTARGSGEALSIREMIGAMVERHAIDRSRVYVTGLSAGGAMASAMLASYPDVFAGGSIIAGLPYGSAGTVPEAFDRMRGHGGPSAAQLQHLLRTASKHNGPWPTLSVWHGDADRTVASSNMDKIVDQWRDLHGLGDAEGTLEIGPTFTRRFWRDRGGRIVVESYTIPGMGHGTPLHTMGADGYGASGPFMLEAGISSTLRMAEFWGLVPARAHETVEASIANPVRLTDSATGSIKPDSRSQIGRVIEDALRSAGLMR